MMKKNLDELLTYALAPTEEPPFALDQQLFSQMMEVEKMKKRKVPAAALAAAVILCFSSLTVFASWQYLSSSQVAEKIQDKKLADYFADEEALQINETQNYGGYRVTFLGIISGEALSDYENQGNAKGRTYAVVAIEKEDGTPMPDVSEDAYGNLNFFVSPLIGGCNPTLYNAASMGGGYSEFNENGILYRLIECDNVEIFADHEMYLCVSDTSFYSAALYNYDENSGIISRNEDYTGLNALFHLPLDASKADPAEADKYIESLNMESFEENVSESSFDTEILFITGNSSANPEITCDNEKQNEVVTYALGFLGTPYAYGESSLTDGTDSSGFVMSVYDYFGYTLPHSAAEDKTQGTAVESLADAQAGDLICYDNPSHVAIYVGDGTIIHVDTAEGVERIAISDEKLGKISSIRRIITEE